MIRKPFEHRINRSNSEWNDKLGPPSDGLCTRHRNCNIALLQRVILTLIYIYVAGRGGRRCSGRVCCNNYVEEEDARQALLHGLRQERKTTDKQ